MTRAEQIAAVLAEHEWSRATVEGEGRCACGWSSPGCHPEHVAAAVDAALAEAQRPACVCPTEDYCPRCHPRWYANFVAAQEAGTHAMSSVVCTHDPVCRRLDNGWPACGANRSEARS